MELIDRLITTMDNNAIPINTYLDLSKAFDRIDHILQKETKLLWYKQSGTRSLKNLFNKSLSVC